MKLDLLLKKHLNLIGEFYQHIQSTNTKIAKHGNNVFIHIPRTGGSTILKEIKKYNLDINRNCEFNHDPLFKLQKINNWKNDVFIYCFVRNPFKRSYSYYHHYLKSNKYCNFNNFLLNIKLKIGSNTTPYYIYPQSFFVCNDQGEISLSKIFKFEEYENGLNEIKKKYNINFNFGHENKTSWHKDDFLKDYTEENKNLVRELFSVDFFNFNYQIEGNDVFF